MPQERLTYEVGARWQRSHHANGAVLATLDGNIPGSYLIPK